jgi:hypothetical protein
MRLMASAFALALVSACSSMPMMSHHAAQPARPAAAPAPAPAATAQPLAPAAAAPTRIAGEVRGLTATSFDVVGQDNSTSVVMIGADSWIVKTRPIQASEIKAGDFVATANTNNSDGTGTSTELRVFPPGMHLGEGSYPMQAPNTTMTNATVAQVTNVGGGRQLTVTYGANAQNNSPAGTRTITLPASVQVIQWYRVQLSDLRSGDHVRGRVHPDASGALQADFVLVDNPPSPAPAAH